MQPTYATYDPLMLQWMDNGLVTDRFARAASDIGVGIPTPPPYQGRPMRGYGAYGQTDMVSPDQIYQDTGIVAQPSVGSGILSSIGDALSNIIRTVGYQAPGMITGQPLPGQVYPGYYPTTSPLGGIPPLVLIGGVVLVGYLLMRKR